MLEIYHHPLCPFSRKLRIVLNEKKVEFELIQEKFWERRPEFMALNPAGETPVVIKQDKTVLASNNAIFEYFEEVISECNLIGETPLEKAKVRRITEWFDNKFYNEVTRYLISEKFIKAVVKVGEPNSSAIRAAKKNIAYHLDYINFLLTNNDYLCGEKITLADFAAAAQLSVLDFIGDVPWERSERVKHWYSLIKSRPSFKAILFDKVPSIMPPKHYSDPDF
jgi:glutathione S-transferase